jgi:carboxyl-terminal processing protease
MLNLDKSTFPRRFCFSLCLFVFGQPLFLALLLTLLWVIPTTALGATTATVQATKVQDTKVSLPMGEIADLVLEQALVPPNNIFVERFALSKANEDAVATFLRSFDRYATYHTATQYKNLLAGQNASSGGVGMDLLQDINGNIICMPFQNSPAALEGIRYGDILLGVNTQEVTQEANSAELDAIASLLRGNPGSNVALRLNGKDGLERNIQLVRKNFARITVVQEAPLQGIPRIRIYNFAPTTLQEFNDVLAKISADKLPDKIILDLRGNTGSDMLSGLEIAKLFLHAGARLPDIRSRTEKKRQKIEQNGKFAEMQVIFWQDGLTAGAAELLITALSEENKSLGIGCTSAGKATIQQIFTLADGSVLKLTTQEMLFPESDTGWDLTGIDPIIPIKNSYPKAADADDAYGSGTVLGDDVQFEKLTTKELSSNIN